MSRVKLQRYSAVQIGPDARGIGGIETVIEYYTHASWKQISTIAIASWRSPTIGNTRSRSRLCSAGLELIWRRLQGYRIGHVHLSHHGSLIREGILAWWSRLLGYHVVGTLHGSSFNASLENSRLQRMVARLALRALVKIAVLNQDTKDTVTKLGLGTRTCILPNPGPIFDVVKEPDAPNSTENIVFAGSIGYRKGVDTLFSAWSLLAGEFPDARLQLFGPVESGFKVPDIPSTSIKCVSRRTVTEALGRARVAVLPSRAEEMPMFVLEAMGTGRPIVASSVGAVPELICGCGISVPPGSVEALVAAIRVYLTDPLRADLDGKRATEIYTTRFSLDVVEHYLVGFYE